MARMPDGVNKAFPCTPNDYRDFDIWHWFDVQQVRRHRTIAQNNRGLTVFLASLGDGIVCYDWNHCWFELRSSHPHRCDDERLGWNHGNSQHRSHHNNCSRLHPNDGMETRGEFKHSSIICTGFVAFTCM